MNIQGAIIGWSIGAGITMLLCATIVHDPATSFCVGMILGALGVGMGGTW